MYESEYPERLKLFKEEDEGQDHYFIIVDEEGNSISSGKKWYPIESGYLQISVSSLANVNHFIQVGKTTENEEVGRDQKERLEGEGKFHEGTQNALGSPKISHFGNSNKHDEISVIIEGNDVEHERFSLFGFKSALEVGYSSTERFNLNIVLNTERFNDLREIVNRGNVEKIFILLWLGNISGLYSSWWSFEGSTFGDIKYFDYSNRKHILNKEEFDEDFINDVGQLTRPDLSSGADFTISTNEKVGGFSIPKTPFEKLTLELDEIEETSEDLFDEKPLSKEEKEEIKRNEEMNIERSKVVAQVSTFWAIVTIGTLLLLTLWFQ